MQPARHGNLLVRWEAAIINWRRKFPWPRRMEGRPPDGGMNLLDLQRPARRWQGFYWASVIASIAVHGGFLAYVFAYARVPGQPSPRPRLSGINVEVSATKPFAAMRRGDRVAPEARFDEDPPEARFDKESPEARFDKEPPEARSDQESPEARLDEDPPEARLDNAPPEMRLDEDAVKGDVALPGAKALAQQMDAPLPEDSARTAKSLPLPEGVPKHRFGPSPAARRAPAIATPRGKAGAGMSLPARRMSRMPAEERLSERRAADPQAEAGPAMPDAIPLPPLKLLAAPEKAALAAGSEESRASVLDMGAHGSPVAAVLPKEAGIAMFAARIVEDAPMLPEDRSPVPGRPSPEQTQASRPVPPPARRVARLAQARRGGEAEPANPKTADGKSARGLAAARKARGYQAKVRAHLAGNKPAGGYGSGRAVVAFKLSPRGGLISARIVRSSGRPSLDQRVLESVFRSEPFPKAPEGLEPGQLRFLIPFEFR
jgi:protein TonB